MPASLAWRCRVNPTSRLPTGAAAPERSRAAPTPAVRQPSPTGTSHNAHPGRHSLIGACPLLGRRPRWLDDRSGRRADRLNLTGVGRKENGGFRQLTCESGHPRRRHLAAASHVVVRRRPGEWPNQPKEFGLTAGDPPVADLASRCHLCRQPRRSRSRIEPSNSVQSAVIAAATRERVDIGLFGAKEIEEVEPLVLAGLCQAQKGQVIVRDSLSSPIQRAHHEAPQTP